MRTLTTALCLVLLSMALLGGSYLAWSTSQRRELAACLPSGVSLSSQVASGPWLTDSYGLQLLGQVGIGNASSTPRLPTVEEELNRLEATIVEGKLYTGEGSTIAFHIEDPRVDFEPWMYEGQTVLVVLPVAEQ